MADIPDALIDGLKVFIKSLLETNPPNYVLDVIRRHPHVKSSEIHGSVLEVIPAPWGYSDPIEKMLIFDIKV